jgi:hypothetical protein
MLRIAGLTAFVAAAATIATIGIAAAQAPDPAVSVDVSECVKLTTPEERLACFEAQVEVAKTAPPAPAASGSQSSGAVEFGSDGDQEPEVPEIQARITDLRETVPHAYVITLDNGQVWRQTVPKSYGLREGIPVRIYYSRWRAYRLTNDQLKSFIQVERVR